MMAYRAAVHETTKVSPYEIIFDRTINLPIYISIFDTPIPIIVPGYNI